MASTGDVRISFVLVPCLYPLYMPARYYGLHGALLLIIMSVVTSKQTQSLVWSQRAVCMVLFLMAELYRCPRAVGDIREGRNCTCRFCSAICLHGLYNLLPVVHKHMGKVTCFGMSKSVRSSHGWLEAAPPPSPLSPVSELVSLPCPCLPRIEVLGGGVFTGGRM